MSITINGSTNTITAASGLTVAGNTAVTGTLSATSTITSSVTTDIDVITATAATTNRKLMRLGNTGGETVIGIEDSVGGNAIVGSTAYDGIIRSETGIAFSANAGLNMQMRLSSTGLAVTGVVSTSGYTVATLPAGTVGQRAYVTDATAPTYLGALTGGGAVTCPVFYNGSAWVSA